MSTTEISFAAVLTYLLENSDSRFFLADMIANHEGVAQAEEAAGAAETPWDDILLRSCTDLLEFELLTGGNDHIERIAMLAHETNRIYCASLGDTSQPKWEDAPEWQRDSACDGVIFLLRHRDATPEFSHANWLAHKRKEGWVYGPVKDPAAKTHPCMVPYADLPPEQRRKDDFFHAIVRSMQP